MQTLLKVLLLPFRLLAKIFKFLYEALVIGLGIALFLAVSGGIVLGIVGFFGEIVEAIKSGNPAHLIMACLFALLSGISYKIFNRIMF
jgi:hypothetical protein